MRLFKHIVWAALLLLGATGAFAQAVDLDAPRKDPPAWVLRGTVPATLDFNCAADLWYQAPPGKGRRPGRLLTVSNSSGGYVADLAGNYYLVPPNMLRYSNQGCLVEEARTNSIRNDSMQGAVAGTPGTLPTNWTSALTGITQTIVGTGTENGIDYMDIEFSGTTSGPNGLVLLYENGTQVAAVQGQVWTASVFWKLISGDFTNVTAIKFGINENNGAGSFLQNNFVNATNPTTTPSLGNQRQTAAITVANASTAFLRPVIQFNNVGSVAINFTLRIGWPQLENNNINSTVTSGAVVSGGTLYSTNDILTVVGGTGTVATLKVTGQTAGIISSVSINSAGSYTVFPSGTISVTGGTGSGATFTLTPTNNAALGFATSPIRTTNASVTRAADVVVVTNPPVFGSAYTLFAAGMPQAPPSYTTNQAVLAASDGTTNNRALIYRASSTAVPTAQTVLAASASSTVTGSAFAQNTLSRSAYSVVAGAQNAAFNSTLGTATTTASIPTSQLTQIHIGDRGDGNAAWWNGYISRVGLWPTTALPSATLQTMTTP